MSLESIHMSTDLSTADTTVATMAVPGYEFMPDPGLLPGRFIDPANIQNPGLRDNFFAVNFAADQNVGANDQSVLVNFTATVDEDLWSQLTSRLDDPYSTDDMSEFSDLIRFQ